MRLKLLTKEERKANEAFGKLITRLHSKNEAERLAAAVELRENWPDGMQRLLISYQALVSNWQKRWRWWGYGVLWFLTGSFLEALCHLNRINIAPFMSLFFFPLILLGLQQIYGPKVRNFYVHNLLNFEDVKIVGPLIDALAFRDEITQQGAREALTRLLPRLQVSDSNLLNGEQREQLRKMLFTDHTELIVSVLQSYEHIGDSAELETLERLLEMPLWDVEVREAAEACLPFLQLRAQQMQSSQTLLRASEHATAPDILLRPAVNSRSEDETQLLRMPNS